MVPIAEKLVEFGCYEISLGDTIGVGTPGSIAEMLKAVKKSLPVDILALHCHDTYGQGLANILVGLEEGIRVFDSSTAGLGTWSFLFDCLFVWWAQIVFSFYSTLSPGGCPYAKGATGNVATEDVIYMLHGMGLKTGVDLSKVVQANKYIMSNLGKKSESRAGNAMLAKLAAASK